jgi:hypothetical protein
MATTLQHANVHHLTKHNRLNEACWQCEFLPSFSNIHITAHSTADVVEESGTINHAIKQSINDSTGRFAHSNEH